jgi:hypothetical protein
MGAWGYIGLAYGLAAVTLVGYGWCLGVRIRKRKARLESMAAGRGEKGR